MAGIAGSAKNPWRSIVAHQVDFNNPSKERMVVQWIQDGGKGRPLQQL